MKELINKFLNWFFGQIEEYSLFDNNWETLFERREV